MKTLASDRDLILKIQLNTSHNVTEKYLNVTISSLEIMLAINNTKGIINFNITGLTATKYLAKLNIFSSRMHFIYEHKKVLEFLLHSDVDQNTTRPISNEENLNLLIGVIIGVTVVMLTLIVVVCMMIAFGHVRICSKIGKLTKQQDQEIKLEANPAYGKVTMTSTVLPPRVLRNQIVK